MASSGNVYIHLVELWLVFTCVTFHPSTCTIEVTVESIKAYSALLQWNLDSPPNTTVTGFDIFVQGSVAMKLEETITDAGARSHHLVNLDDMRRYNACVTTVVVTGSPETGCRDFTTPAGTSTYLAIACGVFLVLCFVTFGILDFMVSSKRKGKMSHMEDELLEQGWQTFQRNSKKRAAREGKKRAAPKPPGPDSTVEPVN